MPPRAGWSLAEPSGTHCKQAYLEIVTQSQIR